MLEQIYASKLYKSSPRKDKIRAAIANPLNSELVGQLASALDDPYKRPELVVKDYDEKLAKADVSEPEVSDTSDVGMDEPNVGSLGGGHLPNPSAIPEGDSPKGSDKDPSSEESLEQFEDVPEPQSPESVQESSNMHGQTILGSKARSEFKDMRQIADQIKGMLNFKDSTAGVNRILTKENELWIYYNDDVNLNNIMADAIELLNASCYTYLEFNRLARSDNAIVFQIDFSDTASIVKQMGGDKS